MPKLETTTEIANPENYVVQAKSVGLTIKHNIILDNISFDIGNNEILTLIGPNGAGKSSLLALIIGLRQPTSGQILRKPNLTIGFVPQFISRDKTLPMTVNDFIKLSIKRASSDDIKDILQQIQIENLSKKFISELSGGELRKVLFARALLNKPQLLVLDEPTAGIDVQGQASFYQDVNRLKQQYGFSVLMVSHDLHLVMAQTDRVICLNKHICCSGKPANIANNPKYLDLFGLNEQMAFYQHHDYHDHNHDHNHDDHDNHEHSANCVPDANNSGSTSSTN